MTAPYYSDESTTIYCGDAREIAPDLPAIEVVATDPPYPNGAGHFDDGIPAAIWVLSNLDAARWFVFWHQLEAPRVRARPLVARHIWHRTNTNRPDNYEAIYEYAAEPERPSRVFPFPVVYPGLTGCKEATGHPTQKPKRLLTALLTLRKHDDGIVLDPFMGSGTTIDAAKSLGRRAIGIEIDERHCEDAARRLAQGVLDLGA